MSNNRRKNNKPITHLARLKYVNKVINNSYYSKFFDHMKEVMEISLDPTLINSPAGHLEVQKVVYSVLDELEPLITRGRGEVKSGAKKDLLVQAHRNKLIASGYREIADGLAWRTLGYDRARIRVLSEANSPGHIATPDGPKIGRQLEFKYANNVVGNGGYVLMHDVTSQFLIGDLSTVRNFGEIPHLAEVKSKKLITPKTILEKQDKGRKLSNQEHRLIQAQLLMEKDEMGNYSNPVKVMRINVPVVTFHADVMQAISEARNKGFSRIKPANYIVIEVIDFANKDLDTEKVMPEERPFEGDKVMPFSNYDNLAIKIEGQIMRAKAPYTVYPYPIADRIDLMTGGLYLHLTLSITKLESEFAKRGWKLEVNMPEDRKPYQDIEYGGSELFKGVSDDDLVVTLSHLSSGFVVKVDMNLFSHIGHEFFTIDDVLIPYVEKMRYDLSLPIKKYAKGYVFPMNVAENTVWD